MNAKNQLLEILQQHGMDVGSHLFTQTSTGASGGWHSSVELMLGGHYVYGEGTSNKKSDAGIAAAADALDMLSELLPELFEEDAVSLGEEVKKNAKNRLLEYVQSLGLSPNVVRFKTNQTGMSGGWRSLVEVTLPDGRSLSGVGLHNGKRDAEIAACEEALAGIETHTAEESTWSDAQPGDLLIKLAAYMTLQGASPEERSQWLQQNEQDVVLAELFDRWWGEGISDVRDLGSGRGTKYKATAVEALIWRKFKDRVLRPDAKEALAEIVKLVSSK